MAKRRVAASGFGSPKELSSRILESIQQAQVALESGAITEKEFGSRVRSAMRLASGLPENARRKLQLDAQTARLTAKDSVKLRASPRTPRVQTAPVDLASFNTQGQEPAQRRLRALSGGDQFVKKALGGETLPNVTEPRIARALETGNKPAVQKAVKGQQKAGALKRGGAIAGGGALGAIILSKLFAGKQNDGLDPAVQMQLQQRLGAGGGGQQGGVNTSRTLSDVGRLLTIIKTLQSTGGLQGPASQEPRLI